MTSKKIITKDSDNFIKYIVDESESITYQSTRTIIGSINVGDLLENDITVHTVLEAVLPGDIAPEIYSYDGLVFTKTNQHPDNQV